MREKFTKEMESQVDSIENKAINLAAYIQNLAVEEKAIIDAIEDMQLRAKKITKKIVFLKDYLRSQLEACNLLEVTKSPYFVIKVKKNPPSVFVSDNADLDDEYVTLKVTKSPNKSLIMEHLKQGVVIQGCELQQDTRVEIK